VFFFFLTSSDSCLTRETCTYRFCFDLASFLVSFYRSLPRTNCWSSSQWRFHCNFNNCDMYLSWKTNYLIFTIVMIAHIAWIIHQSSPTIASKKCPNEFFYYIPFSSKDIDAVSGCVFQKRTTYSLRAGWSANYFIGVKSHLSLIRMNQSQLIFNQSIKLTGDDEI